MLSHCNYICTLGSGRGNQKHFTLSGILRLLCQMGIVIDSRIASDILFSDRIFTQRAKTEFEYRRCICNPQAHIYKGRYTEIWADSSILSRLNNIQAISSLDQMHRNVFQQAGCQHYITGSTCFPFLGPQNQICCPVRIRRYRSGLLWISLGGCMPVSEFVKEWIIEKGFTG